jgi:hypothetical protein
MKRNRRAAALAGTMTVLLAAAVSGGTAYAQDNAGAAAPPPGGPTMVQDAPADSPNQTPGAAPANTAAAAGSATGASAPSGGTGTGGPGGHKGGGQLSGYSYGTHDSPEVQAILAGHRSSGGGAAAPRPPHGHRNAKATTGAVATYPGFAMRDDGGSRVFVQLTKAVPVEEHKAAGQITYVLKGAHVTERNNENALVTVHFNTPVSRARLRPVGHDLALTIELRGAASPTYKVEGGTDGGSRLVVDFPEGQFLDNDGEPLRAAGSQVYLDGQSPTGRSASRAGGARRGGGRRGGGGHPSAPSSSGMSDTTDSTP